jgi:hypothetical protein
MKKLITLFYCIMAITYTFAQIDVKSNLFKTIKEKDSLLFNIGFNTCDISQFENLVSDNFEFYHDKSGITPNKTVFLDNTRNGLCKMSYKAKRVLIDGSMQVFPLYKNGEMYGAIQNAKHEFYAIEKDKPEFLTNVALFTHLWLLENGQWKLSRVFSFDHKTPDELGRKP